MQKNEFFEIQSDYLKQLESSYQRLQNTKEAKKFGIIRIVKIIQQWWRKLILKRRIKATTFIQRSFRRLRSQFRLTRRRIRLLRRKTASVKIQRWFRLIRKINIISKHPASPSQLKGFQEFAKQIIKIQALVRGFLVRRTVRF